MVLVLTKRATDGIFGLIHDRCSDEAKVDRVEVVLEGPELAPADFLRSALQVPVGSGTDIITVQSLLSQISFPDVLVIEGLDNLRAEYRQRWLRFFEEWVRFVSTQKDALVANKAFLILTRQDWYRSWTFQHPRLTVEWLWDCLSLLETRLFARMLCEQYGLDPAETLWAESVFAELALGDVHLLSELVGSDPFAGEISIIESVLLRYGKEHHWNAQLLTDLGCDSLAANSHQPGGVNEPKPTGDVERLWSEGVLLWTPEQGREVHSSALALLGEQEALRHRVWRGQARVLFPLIDGARLQIAKVLETRLDRISLPVAAGGVHQEGRANWEFSCLLALLDTIPNPWGRAVQQVTRELRYIRNNLAHYNPLSWERFRYLLSVLDRLGDLVHNG